MMNFNFAVMAFVGCSGMYLGAMTSPLPTILRIGLVVCGGVCTYLSVLSKRSNL